MSISTRLRSGETWMVKCWTGRLFHVADQARQADQRSAHGRLQQQGAPWIGGFRADFLHYTAELNALVEQDLIERLPFERRSGHFLAEVRGNPRVGEHQRHVSRLAQAQSVHGALVLPQLHQRCDGRRGRFGPYE
jgi:hypothetical protein